MIYNRDDSVCIYLFLLWDRRFKKKRLRRTTLPATRGKSSFASHVFDLFTIFFLMARLADLDRRERETAFRLEDRSSLWRGDDDCNPVASIGVIYHSTVSLNVVGTLHKGSEKMSARACRRQPDAYRGSPGAVRAFRVREWTLDRSSAITNFSSFFISLLALYLSSYPSVMNKYIHLEEKISPNQTKEATAG